MFKELTKELLDLSVEERGYGNALYAKWLTDGGSCCRLSSACCCCFCVNCGR